MQTDPDHKGMTEDDRPLISGIGLAVALSLGAAVSLGITRFAYGLLLPLMRDDLSWSYTLAGAMNTFNAIGYLVGALSASFLMRRCGSGVLLLSGSVLASIFMAGSGFFTEPAPLLLQRLLAGVVSAWVFVSGGLLAARLGSLWPSRSGLLLGLYYGGTGLGIVASSWAVPLILQLAGDRPHAWTWAWWVLAFLCVLATWGLALALHSLRRLGIDAGRPGETEPSRGQKTAMADLLRRFSYALSGYGLFGVGYIGYMTFVIALLREQGADAMSITVFYSLLGLAVLASSRIWAGMLDRYRDGRPLARLNALLGVATLLPAVTASWPVVLLSGILFGGVFLSVVASTTALVRHNLPSGQWAAGISAFTVVFALGQIVGPTVVGWVADSAGGLERGLLYSALALWVGAVLAQRQKALR